MKSNSTSKKFPNSTKDWDAILRTDEGAEKKVSGKELQQWAQGVVVNGGGYKAVRAALETKRKQGARGPQASPTKQLVSVRYSPEVLEFFRGTGAGWQARMDDVLKQWISRARS